MTFVPTQSYALNAKAGYRDGDADTTYVTHALTAEGHDASEDGTGRGTPLVAAPLSHGSNPNSNAAGRRREDDENLVAGFNHTGGGSKDVALTEDATPPLDSSNHGVGMLNGASVRRLTPTECERLQGFPDGWTQLGDTADSKRYAALGDAVTVPVAEWIGRRILAAEDDYTSSHPRGGD